MLREALFADYRFSARRYLTLLAVISAVSAVGGVYFAWPAAGWLAKSSRPLDFYMFEAMSFLGVLFFVYAGLFLSTGPIWWLLCRLNLRGWASSLVAGGLLMVCAVGIPIAMSATFPDAAKHGGLLLTRVVVALGLAPIGIWLAWAIWRVSFVDPAAKGANKTGDT